MAEDGWAAAGQGFEGKEATLRLAGWSRARRVVLLRRPLARELAVVERDDGQLRLSFLEVTPQGERRIYEVAVLDLARGRDPDPGPALSRPRRLRERVRRAQEPLGLGRLHHPGSQSMLK